MNSWRVGGQWGPAEATEVTAIQNLGSQLKAYLKPPFLPHIPSTSAPIPPQGVGIFFSHTRLASQVQTGEGKIASNDWAAVGACRPWVSA
eukprot:superscaffoldBa00000357_g4063